MAKKYHYTKQEIKTIKDTCSAFSILIADYHNELMALSQYEVTRSKEGRWLVNHIAEIIDKDERMVPEMFVGAWDYRKINADDDIVMVECSEQYENVVGSLNTIYDELRKHGHPQLAKEIKHSTYSTIRPLELKMYRTFKKN